MKSLNRVALRALRNRASCLRSFAAVPCLASSKMSLTLGGQFARRSMKTLDFGGQLETVYERSDYPKQKFQALLGKDTFAMLGYGTQGRAQALNLRDNGLKVVVGNIKDANYELALKDGWVPGKTLLDIKEAAKLGTVVMYLLSDAGQKDQWENIKPFITKGKTLYFSHGFSYVFKDRTGVVPPPDVDVVLVAPKGSGTSVRNLFVQGSGINSSFAVAQDYSGKARERTLAMGVAVGSGYLFETTFEKEVYSDLTGERGVLMGAIQGIMKAQYEVLRANGHSVSESFNETVEEATQSLYRLIGENGMDWMYNNCSTTARRGALDWYPRFYEATKPVFEDLYARVKSGEETQRTLDTNGAPDYREKLQAELDIIGQSEMWRGGATVRSLRPERQPKSN